MEGIDWSFQNFVDNRACLDLIEPKKDKCLLYNSHFTSPRFKVKTTCLACITLPGACLTKSKDSSRKTRLGFVSKQVTSTDADHVPRTLAQLLLCLSAVFVDSLGLLPSENDVVPRLTPFPHRTLSVLAFAEEMKPRLEIQHGRIKSVKELCKLARGEFIIVYSHYKNSKLCYSRKTY